MLKGSIFTSNGRGKGNWINVTVRLCVLSWSYMQISVEFYEPNVENCNCCAFWKREIRVTLMDCLSKVASRSEFAATQRQKWERLPENTEWQKDVLLMSWSQTEPCWRLSEWKQDRFHTMRQKQAWTEDAKHPAGHSCPKTLPPNVARGHILLLAPLFPGDPYLAPLGLLWLD